MPIFEFECQKCSSEFESLVLRQRERVCCPHCDSRRVKRLMSGFAHKSGGKMVTSGGGNTCGGCAGGSCATCH